MHTWLWQHPDWTTRLRWDAARLLPVLAAARRAQGRLLGRADALELGLGEHRARTLVQEAVTTSAVEGEHLDPDVVRSSVARRLHLPTAGLPAVQRATDGLVEALLHATQGADEPLTAARLQGWQAALFPTGFSGMRRVTVGAWRTDSAPMQVVSGREGRERVHFEAPPAAQVATEMARFLLWWEHWAASMDGLLRAGLAHLWFVTVHPFDDGNGRVARVLTEHALARDEGTAVRLYSPSARILQERAPYYAALEAAQRGDGEVTDWLAWFVGCLHRAIEDAEQGIDGVLDRARFWQAHAGLSLGPRQRKVVERLLLAGREGFEGGLTTRKYVALTGTSRATAQREIAELLDAGLLTRLPGGGRSTRYALVWDDHPATS